jgi:hypothetical protein
MDHVRKSIDASKSRERTAKRLLALRLKEAAEQDEKEKVSETQAVTLSCLGCRVLRYMTASIVGSKRAKGE